MVAVSIKKTTIPSVPHTKTTLQNRNIRQILYFHGVASNFLICYFNILIKRASKSQHHIITYIEELSDTGEIMMEGTNMDCFQSLPQVLTLPPP